MKPRFGPAGNSESFAAEGFKSTVDTPQWLAKRGLDAFEYQCGRGVNIGDATAKKIGEEARKYHIALSIHAPYFINLSSVEAERVEKNIQYVLSTCHVAQCMGATRLTVHCGGQGKLAREKAVQNTLENLRHILRAMDEGGFSEQTICLETMGKQSVLGSAEEVFTFVAFDDRLLPCIDFGHLNARTQGKYRSMQAFEALFDDMVNMIGIERAAKFHSHFSKIAYTDKGEKNHLTFADTIYGPEFEPIAQLVAARGWAPTFICESAGTQAEDAITMQTLYEGAKAR